MKPEKVDFGTWHSVASQERDFSCTKGTYPLGRREAGGETQKMLVLQNLNHLAEVSAKRLAQQSFDCLLDVAAVGACRLSMSSAVVGVGTRRQALEGMWPQRKAATCWEDWWRLTDLSGWSR